MNSTVDSNGSYSREKRDALMMDIAWWYRNRYRIVGLVMATAMIVMMFGYHLTQSWKQAELIQGLETQREDRRAAFNLKKKKIEEKNKEELEALEAKLQAHLEEQRGKYRSQLNEVEVAKDRAEQGVKAARTTVASKQAQLQRTEAINKKRSKDMMALLDRAHDDIDAIEEKLRKARIEEAKLEDELARRTGRQSVSNAKNQDDAIVQHAIDEFTSDQRKLRASLDQINIADRNGTDSLALRNNASALYNRMKGLHTALEGILQSEPELGRRFAGQINPALRAGTGLTQEYEAMTQRAR